MAACEVHVESILTEVLKMLPKGASCAEVLHEYCTSITYMYYTTLEAASAFYFTQDGHVG